MQRAYATIQAYKRRIKINVLHTSGVAPCFLFNNNKRYHYTLVYKHITHLLNNTITFLFFYAVHSASEKVKTFISYRGDF